MKKTFLILLVLFCVATMALSTASAATDDTVSDDVGTVDVDNTIETVSSSESDFSSDNLAIDDEPSISDDSGANDKSLESAPLKEGGTTIYVSTTGSDENDGLSEATSVATVGKGIEIVNATEGTDFTIRVANGNYNIEKIESPAAKNVNLIGESKEGAILHASGTYGINVYEDNIKWSIENLTICDFNSTTSTSAAVRCFASDSDFNITNCIFKNIGSKNGAIYITSTGARYISNVLIEDCFGTYSSTSSIIHLYGEGQVVLDNIEIKGSYMDPSVGTATYLRSVIYADQSQTNVILKNSRIIDNIGAIGSLIEAKGIFNVINTTFANNYINYSANGVNGGTYMFYSGTSSNSASNINITQSVIMDNTIAGGSIGLFNVVYGTHNIDHNIIMNNKYANGNDVPLGSFSGGTISTDDNYWGTNERPNTKTTKWVILTVDAPEMAFVGVNEAINVCLNTYNTTSGETGEITGMPTVDLGVTYALNQQNPNTVTVENGQGTLNYLATVDGDETLTFSTGDAFSFEVNADVSTLIYVDASAESSGTGTADSPFKTIAEALNIAADGKIIVVRTGTYKEKNLNVMNDITIKADKDATVIIDAENGGRIFSIMSTSTLRDLTLINGNVDAYGAGIFDAGTLTLNNVKIFNCTAEDGGAAVYVFNDANLTVVSCQFIDNEADEGGAIFVDEDATANITTSKFLSNDPENGGAIYVAGTASIENNEFTSNNATNGGAIYIDSTEAQTIKGNTFTSNTADKGKAIYIKNAPVSLSDNVMGEGQDIYLDGASLKTTLKFLNGQTINADFGETVTITATLTDEDGNPVRGGIVTITANGETIATIDLSGDAELTTTYTVPETATGDITISGSYSLDNEGTVVPGVIHPAISYWFIEGGSGYETLAQAINAASAGDVIYYDLPDDYTEVISSKSIAKALTIKNNGTGVVTIDGNKNQIFSISGNVELDNLNFINGGTSQGGFITQSSGYLYIYNSTFKDSTSSSNGAVIYKSAGNFIIDGCTFENLTGKEGAIYFNDGYAMFNLSNSVFNNMNGSYDGWVLSLKGPANITNCNFTNLKSSQATSSSYYGAVYATKAMNVSGCYFANITGPKGAAIYSMGALNVTKSVFDSINTTFSIIFASGAPSDISYNIFLNNGNTKAVDSSIADCDYNFWGSNEKPSTSVIAANRYTYWTVIELLSGVDTVYMGTTADINVQFMGTDGTETLTLEGEMPDYTVDLTASSGTLEPTAVTIVENNGFATFTPTSEGTVTITATPGPAELILNVMDTAALLVVSSDGSDETGAGTLDNPYATIAHALSQVTDTRNIIYIKDADEVYQESGLTISQNVTIRGENSGVTIDGGNVGQIFIVTGTLTIEDVTLTGGMTNDIGGAIYANGGSVTVNHVTFESNGAGSGGAIGATNGASLTVTDSTFTENMAVYGGAIYVDTTGDVSITTSSFEDNVANDDDAIYIKTANVELLSNTLGEDQVIFVKSGSVKTNLTFIGGETQNVEFGQTVTLTATLTDVDGNPVIGGNVIFTANGETIATIDTANADLTVTYTVPSDATSDIAISGAYSFDNGGTVVNGTLHPAISYWFIEGGSGYETLAQAVAAAQAGDVIYGTPGTYTVSGVALNKAITIKANESGAIILDGGASQIFTVSSNVNLINLTLANGKTSGNGGLISVSSGSLTANNTIFKDTVMSTSSTQGGAIYSSGKLYIYNSVFENLQARQGAAIWEQSSSDIIVIDNCVFNNINATYDGGVIRSGSSTTITKSNFTNIKGDTSSGNYGNIYMTGGNLTISECNFINNSGPGGALVYFTSSTGGVLNITKTLFENITTAGKGIIYSTKESYINYNVFLNVNEGVNITSNYLGNGNIDYNYWGTNENPSTVMKTYSPTYWVVMTVTPNEIDSIPSGATQAFTVDFTHYTDGTANYTMADTIPELTVSASAVKGSLDQSAVETVSNVATFTYTAAENGEETVTFTNANVTIPVTFVVGDGYYGIVYVSKDGSDENRGSEDAPVASIAKAVEIAQAGSGQIIVNEGTYVVKGVNITEDLEISSVGEVIFDGDGTRALYVQSGEVSISNITFTNCLEQYSGSAIRVSGGSLSLDGCKFIDNGGANARDSIINVKNAALIINDCLFENNTAHPTSTSYSVVYASDSTLIVNNTVFNNNQLKYGAIYLSGTIAVINNTDFTGFSSVSSSGGSGCGIYASGTAAYEYANGTVRPGAPSIVLVENCKFINNTANGGASYAGQGAAIYVNNNATVIVKDSKFINNTCMDNTDGTVTGKGGAIYASAGNVQISNSVFEGNVASEGSEIYMRAYGPDVTTLNALDIHNCIIKDDGSSVIVSNYTNGSLVANSNWWGSNANPADKVSEGIAVDNWVIMNVSPTEATGYTGEALEITVDFKYTMSADGTIETLAGTLPEELTVNANAANGTLDKTTAETTNLVAKFAFTPEFAGENIVNVYTSESNTVPVTIMVTEKYAGPIYVSKDGNDENEGSEDSPVATIAKAIELAQGRSGQIIIGEGTYVESNLTISKDLNITAIGDVIWDANGQRAFSMATGNVSVSNITFINGNHTSYGHLIRCDGDSITFNDCKFISNGGDVGGTNGVIYINLASAYFNNCHFENNTAGTGTSYGLISTKDSVLIVDGCTFVNNYNKNGCIYVSGSSIGSMAIINNTKFIGNNATSASGGSGGAIYASGSLAYQYANGTVRPGAQANVYVVDCEFINNTAFGGTYYCAEGGAIFVNANATLYASNSRFINNTARDNDPGTKLGRGGAIAATTGNVQISNCIFEGNTATNGSTISMKFANNDLTVVNVLNISNSVIMGPGEKLISSDFTNGSLIANNNWWASNENPSDKVTEGITVDSWVILTADPSEITAVVNQPVAITANFRHTNNTDGVIGELEGAFPELEVYGMALDDSPMTESNMTVDNVATLYYTPEELGETTVYVIAGNAMVPIKVTVTDAPEPSDVIYVSPTGSDDNPGTYEAPVATIAKAVELAGAEGAQGTVIVESGIYNENGIVINSAHPISITGNGTVIIRGNNHQVNGNGALVVGAVSDSTSIMIVNTSQAVLIKNLQFADNIAANGGAILINPSNSRELMTVDVTVEECSFENLQGRDGGGIYGTYLNGTVAIINSNFTKNTATAWGGAVSLEYSAYENDDLKLEVVGSNFENNTANNGGALYLMVQDITIKDSVIANNNATYYPGALYLQNCTAFINNTVIANNSAKYDKAAIAIHGATISYETREVNPSNVVITNCIIENNTGRDRVAPAIYLENSNLNMSYCSVVNDMNINNTVTATYGTEQPGAVIVNNNWWGTNDPSSTITGTNITMDNWVIMNVVANATEVDQGAEVKLTVDFNHVNTTAGEIEELTGGVIPRDSYTVSFAVDNGTIAPETVTVANGESGEAIFTAANANALITVTSENAVETELILVGDQVEPYTGIVYVSKDGDDSNEGSEDAPVATLAKAIEIATAETGSGQIIIKEGTYTGNGYNITKDLIITGEGDVIIDALSEGNRLFNIGYGSGVTNFELHNLVLDNLEAFYGAAVYSYASNLVLDNITITGIESETSRLITSNSNTTIKDCVFANNTVSGIITQGGNNNLNIVNTLIEGNNVTYDSSIFGVVYVSSGKGNITIEDSKFYDNLVRQSTVRGYTETNITVKGSEFINNTADNSPYYSSGGAIYAQANLDVTDSIFINNNARRDGGAIYIGPNGQATITKSEFINNNVYSDEYGDAIYTKGTTTVNYCIFLTNGTRYVIYNDGSNAVNAQYNWWGTNDNPQGLVNNVDASNWIIMNVVADTEDVEAGAALPITVDFKHYIDANGAVQELADSLAQELTVNFISETGALDNTEVTTVDHIATATYTVVDGANSIAVKSSNAVVNIAFEIVKTETSLSVVAEPITVGETAVINVSLTDIEGNAINGTVIVNVNGEDKEVTVTDGAGSLELTGLAANTYPITAHFEATSKYAASDATGSLVVNLKETKLTVVVDDVVTGESSNITATLTDADGNPISGTVKVAVGDNNYTITVENGKGSVSTDAFDEIGTVDVVAKYDGDDTMAPVEINSQITVYGPGNVTVKHTDAGDAHDIQAAIDAANPGDIVRLGDYDYTDVSDVNITKDVAIVGSEGTTVTSAGDNKPIFNVPAKSENGPDSVNITGIDFKVNNGDTIVKAIAENDTNPLSIDTQAISITNNTIEAANKDVVPESVNVLKLESERGVLAPTNEISVSGNTMDAGINPFDFDITSVTGESGEVIIPSGPITKERIETQIIYQNMTTTAVDVDTDGRIGKYFYITLKDKKGNLLKNKPIQIGFNGVVYDRTTDENGSARLQINLKNAGTYTFAVSYLGDDEYNGSFIVAKIVVNKQKGSLTVPNKSYKATASTKSLTATFKSASGKVVKGKKITFTVNGKSYSATTNAKGVATVKVSLNTKGTYSFTAKFAGNTMYAAISKKATLKLT